MKHIAPCLVYDRYLTIINSSLSKYWIVEKEGGWKEDEEEEEGCPDALLTSMFGNIDLHMFIVLS